ncbi:MAG: lamin tail domain-containing protein, partial [Candidatus Limnocylindrales bacterium]
MGRAPRAGLAALVLIILASTIAPATRPALAGPVVWPTSSLVISELLTGGASASDEFVEIANQGPAPVDLIGLEVVYATSSGSTVTRKATWPASQMLAPGQRTLVANASGIFALGADVVYASGFAATGGAVALRVVGGSVLDAVGWGDASNAFVEGSAAAAAPARSSLERLPGGLDGNDVDTNDNRTDWFVNGVPGPQGLAAAPVPDPGPTPTAAPTPTPTAAPTPTPTLIVDIAEARAAVDDTSVTVVGILTTDLGALDSGHTGFLQDTTGGIAIYLESPVVLARAAGTRIQATGTIGSRYAQRTLRVDETVIVALDAPGMTDAVDIPTGSATEPFEGRRIGVEATVLSGSDALADGLAVSVD